MNRQVTDAAPGASPVEVISTRVFDAPRETVFGAFEDARQLARWFGPKGFRNTITEFDFRAGGTWRLTMHAPDGIDYANESVFVVVEKPEKIAYRHLGSVHAFDMVMTFAAVTPGQTKLTWHMVFDRTGENARLQNFVAKANEENFDRLAALLRGEQP